jgi:hypothetical protein
VDLLRRIDDGMNRGKMSEMDFRSFFHPDVEFVPLRAAVDGTHRRRRSRAVVRNDEAASFA